MLACEKSLVWYSVPMGCSFPKHCRCLYVLKGAWPSKVKPALIHARKAHCLQGCTISRNSQNFKQTIQNLASKLAASLKHSSFTLWTTSPKKKTPVETLKFHVSLICCNWESTDQLQFRADKPSSLLQQRQFSNLQKTGIELPHPRGRHMTFAHKLNLQSTGQ